MKKQDHNTQIHKQDILDVDSNIYPSLSWDIRQETILSKCAARRFSLIFRKKLYGKLKSGTDYGGSV